MSYPAQHYPHQAPQEYIDKYLNVCAVGWDEIRQQRYAAYVESWRTPIILYGLLEKAFMVYLVTINASSPFSEGLYLPAGMDTFLTAFSILYFVAMKERTK